MPAELLTLLARDHDDLARGIEALLHSSTSLGDIRTILDGQGLGLDAHARAEATVLHALVARAPRTLGPVLERLVAEVDAAHATQAAALMALACTRPRAAGWFARARHLRALVAAHASHEANLIVPVLQVLVPAQYPALAGAFATERLRQLAAHPRSVGADPRELARAG